MKKSTLLPIVFLLPSLIWILTSRFIPLVNSFLFCFYDFTKTPWEFVYFKNFARLAKDPILVRSILNTIWFTSANVGLVFVTSLAVALMLNRQFRGSSILKSILIIPWAIPTVTTGILWLLMLSNFGIVNAILFRLNIIPEYKLWLYDPFWAMFWLVIITAWRDFPMTTIIFTAGLGMIPQDLLDAATLDKASALMRIRHVSLPYIKYVLLTGLLLQLTSTIKSFDMIYVLTRGGPQDSTLTLYYHSFREGFQFGIANFGYSTVLAYLGFLSCIVFYLGYLKLYKLEE